MIGLLEYIKKNKKRIVCMPKDMKQIKIVVNIPTNKVIMLGKII